MLGRMKREQPLPVAMRDRRARHHLSEEQRTPRQLAMEVPAVPVSPVHHGRNGEAPIQDTHSTSFSGIQYAHSCVVNGAVTCGAQVAHTRIVFNRALKLALTR